MEFLILLFVVLLCRVDHITSTNTQDDHHPGFLFDNHPGYILSLPANTKVKQMSTQVSGKMDCVFACVGKPWCRSVNFKMAAEVDGRHICELIATDNYTNPKHLKQDQKFTHLNIKNPCEGNPCLNQGKCIPNGNRLDYRCKCQEGHTGNNCQNDVDECMGSHGCHSDAICVNSPGSFSCQCKPGFVGNGKNCTVAKRDCSDIYKTGERRSGVYTIKPDSQGNFQVYCDMTTDGGGWTVFQRREDGSVGFYLGWQPYKTGFENPNGEFWLGNDYIHRLTAITLSTLRVELEDWARTRKYAKYGSFSVNAESDNYRLSVGSYSGTAGDSLSYHNNMKFTTKDRDNDANSLNCATDYTGAWWYSNCYNSNLNGQYLGNLNNSMGVTWNGFYNNGYSLKFTEMKMRPQTF